ncbi:MAG: ribosomal-processing cysteine protease Prp [Lachnospiraceae bacterium]|nr:ribosomal-processing cysteine protease Prp [Lachnospiraceae bacterium]
MVTATVIKDSSGYVGFYCKGHAGFAKKGKDIVCSAISMLTVNAANSIMTLSESRINVNEEDGFLSWTFEGTADERATLLMDSLILGLRSIEDEYDKKYLKLEIKEVSHDSVKPSVICS